MAAILIVDDEPTILKSMAFLLEDAGHTVLSADGGEQALDIIKNQPVDILMTDIQMSPMDGIQLIAEVKTLRPEMPVIIMSAYSSDNSTRRALEIGAVAYLKKPFKLQDVVDTVNTVSASPANPSA